MGMKMNVLYSFKLTGFNFLLQFLRETYSGKQQQVETKRHLLDNPEE